MIHIADTISYYLMSARHNVGFQQMSCLQKGVIQKRNVLAQLRVLIYSPTH